MPRLRRRLPSSELAYTRAGEGSPLVLIHGLGGEKCVWDPVISELVEHHDVIALDLPGFGRSAPLSEGIEPNPVALARAVADLLDVLGLPDAHLAGNSLGAWVALELARQGRARSVLGLSPAGLWGRPLASSGAPVRGRAHRAARLARPVLPLLLLSAAARRLVLSPFVAFPDRVPYRAAWRMVSSYARATAYDATSAAMRAHHFARPEEIRVRVTLAFGDRDRLVRPVWTAIPGVRTIVLPGCGHIPMWDNTDSSPTSCSSVRGRATTRRHRLGG